ncbi:intraflagellar transport protein 43 homolog isoform X1 [Diaphorina citri]|uniref:Intraflagellar transport protein 43 homolog isoform X1 n=2 Tax=Diaphorina citri TaxID=121845 RepID=A0A1S3CVX8_DIACI|nr:intraflagellar transport protein 43 homolog isoform X1 [Diaphorina citri]
MFRLGKSDVDATSRERKGSADIDIVDGIEHMEKLYFPAANRGKRTTGWSTVQPKEKSPKSSEVQQSAKKLSGSNSMLVSEDLDDDIDDYVADISDATTSITQPNTTLHEMIKESDPKVTFSAVSVLDDIDLSLLTKHLLPLEDVTEEETKVWTWDTLFTKITSDLRAEGKFK